MFALEISEGSLREARDSANRWGEKSEWNKDVDTLSMRVNQLKRMKKRFANPENET